MGIFQKYDREVVRVFQIREHHAQIVKLGRYADMTLDAYRGRKTTMQQEDTFGSEYLYSIILSLSLCLKQLQQP